MTPRSCALAAPLRARPCLRDRVSLAWLVSLLGAATSCAGTPGHSETEAASPARPVAALSATTDAPPAARPKPVKSRVIICVWDGLRPDSISPQVTPNLARLRDHEGVNFSDHHSVYPTFTMMNAAALATGAYPWHHGFYGNTEYQPGPVGQNADGKAIDFSQPVFTEDHGVLQALDNFYRARGTRGLFAVETLFEAAHAVGLRTAAIGKIGPAFLQDLRPDDALSVVLDENIALPFAFAQALQSANFALPVNAVRYPYSAGQALALAANNGKPTAAIAERQVKLADGATPDPRASAGSAHNAANGYLMSTFLEYVLPKFEPDLSIIWLRNPDSTEHQFGPGSPNYQDALRDQDALLGKLQSKLAQLGLRDGTDLIVVSDHGHSTVAGDPAIFPLRALKGEPDGHGVVGVLDPEGYPVSGEIRSADVLKRAGFKHVYDGGGCLLDPVLSGIRKDGSLVYPTRTDHSGSCLATPPLTPTGKKQAPTLQYSLPAFRVPEQTPKDAVVIAANGGSEYYYVLDHVPATVEALVRSLQERRAYGAIFARSIYGAIPGTLPLSAINAEGGQGSPPTPDLIVGFDWDDAAIAAGNAAVPGTEYASAQRYRGMHGSFSPRDVHNVLIARGPHFKVGFEDRSPSGNVDLAPTVAALLAVPFRAPDGRVLAEALAGAGSDNQVEVTTQSSAPIRLRRTCGPDDPGCERPGEPATYSVTLVKKTVTVAETKQRYSYFDRAVVTRATEARPRKPK
ncbi:MAG: alkaline phosphatase family protein [Pseudomonadota bacterium]